MTDAAPYYKMVGKEFANHGRVEHAANEYVRREGERVIHTNTVEGYYSIFKRGMEGIYQHCSEKHLHRYLSEYDFRYNYRVKLGYRDAMRADKALEGIRGKPPNLPTTSLDPRQLNNLLDGFYGGATTGRAVKVPKYNYVSIHDTFLLWNVSLLDTLKGLEDGYPELQGQGH